MKMNNFSKIATISFMLIVVGNSLNAQISHQKIGSNPTIISPSAVLEVESTNKGMLMPRVNLSSTSDQAPIPTASGLPANGLTVFNLSTVSDVTPGYYYWSTPLLKWVRVADQTSVTEPWNVIGQPAGTKATSNTQNIYQMGNVAIGATTIPSITAGASTINPKLHVAGDISTTGKLWTTNSVYADYVFDYYFDGFSKIYEAYKFKSLKEVAEFIRANKHLPGVTPISEIATNEAGYTIDLTQLSMQQLEKLEELYLHVIEMSELMNAKDNEIKLLQNKTKELEERLMKLEKLIINK
jgi:hypothetical protein